MTRWLAGLVALMLSGAALAEDRGPVRSHFDRDRSHFSQNHSRFHHDSAFGERRRHHVRPPPHRGYPHVGRPGQGGPPAYHGQWGHDGRPGFSWHRPQRIDPDERLRRDYERLYDGQRRQFDREQRATIYGTAPRGNRHYGPDRWHHPGARPPGHRPPDRGYPLPPHGYPLPGQSRPGFNAPDRGADLYADPRGPAPATPYSR
ncbi:hypothetical protein M1D97_02985 [Kushneria sp. AK178]